MLPILYFGAIAALVVSAIVDPIGDKIYSLCLGIWLLNIYQLEDNRRKGN